MRSLLVCPDDFLFRLLRGTPTPGEPPLYLVEDRGLRARIARRGAAALAGDLEDPALYRRAFRTGRESVLLAVPHERRDRVLEALRTAAPLAPVVVLKDDARALDPAAPGVTALSAGTIGERVIQPELERAALRARVDRLRAHLAPAERLLILLQDDPDPDAIASALALRTLLGRNKTSAPIATFGGVTRPENRAMIKILDMEAFAYLYLLANHNALRRIERPELPGDALEVLAQGIARRELVDGVLFSHLGPVAYVDLIPQFADFFLQVEGVEWSVVSGIVGGDLHVSVRNVGYIRSAGEVVRSAFGALGGAGGHRAMAKAVIHLGDWRTAVGDASPDAIRHGIAERFLRALRN